MPAVKRWIAYGAAVKGQIHVNEGAKKAILEGCSLLPVGVIKVIGNFNEGDVVSLEDENKYCICQRQPQLSPAAS